MRSVFSREQHGSTAQVSPTLIIGRLIWLPNQGRIMPGNPSFFSSRLCPAMLIFQKKSPAMLTPSASSVDQKEFNTVNSDPMSPQETAGNLLHAHTLRPVFLHPSLFFPNTRRRHMRVNFKSNEFPNSDGQIFNSLLLPLALPRLFSSPCSHVVIYLNSKVTSHSPSPFH